jgi:hypothetical protein
MVGISKDKREKIQRTGNSLSPQLSEQRKLRIRLDAKKMLDDFQEALKGIEFDLKEENNKGCGYREEGEGEKCDDIFRKAMFANAPKTKGDCIVAEKKKW